jgi:hypothetical protein
MDRTADTTHAQEGDTRQDEQESGTNYTTHEVGVSHHSSGWSASLPHAQAAHKPAHLGT